MNQYFGTYQAFATESKKEAGALIGADNLVGDRYDIDIELNEGIHKAWLVNRFGKRIGFFDADFSRQLSIMKARDMAMTAILSFVAYTDNPDPGHYWGEMAVICFNPVDEEPFEKFLSAVSARMAEGSRPNIDLQPESVERVIESGGTWMPKQSVPFPEKERGTVIMKSKRSVSERLIEQGRKGNKGCYLVSWAFLLALVALVIFGLKSCGVF